MEYPATATAHPSLIHEMASFSAVELIDRSLDEYKFIESWAAPIYLLSSDFAS